MQNVIPRSPAKMTFGKEMPKTGNCLIEINQAEWNIESADQNFLFAKGFGYFGLKKLWVPPFGGLFLQLDRPICNKLPPKGGTQNFSFNLL